MEGICACGDNEVLDLLKKITLAGPDDRWNVRVERKRRVGVWGPNCHFLK